MIRQMLELEKNEEGKVFIQDKVVLVGSTKSDENIFDGVQNSGSGKKRGEDVGDTEKTLPKIFSPRRKIKTIKEGS